MKNSIIYIQIKLLSWGFLLGFSVPKDDKKFVLLVSSAAAVGATFFSCLVTHPLDIIRTRVLFQFYNKDKQQIYDGIFDALVKIIKYDGFKGLFRGMYARCLRKMFGGILAWGLYDYLCVLTCRPSII